jgi:hypothetical protein
VAVCALLQLGDYIVTVSAGAAVVAAAAADVHRDLTNGVVK